MKFAVAHCIKCLEIKRYSMIEKQKRLKSSKSNPTRLREGVFFVATINLGLVAATVDECCVSVCGIYGASTRYLGIQNPLELSRAAMAHLDCGGETLVIGTTTLSLREALASWQSNVLVIQHGRLLRLKPHNDVGLSF